MGKSKKSRTKVKPARLERRVRATFFLVAETKEARQAAISVMLYLDAQFFDLQKNGDWEIPVTGFTHSSIPSEVTLAKEKKSLKDLSKGIFWGHWWYPEYGEMELIEERVMLFVVDLPAVAEEWKTDESISLLKTRIFFFYEMHNCPQEEIWIVKQDIVRYA